MGQKEGYTLPVGPYHPALEEPEYFKAYVKGEDIIGLDLSIGFHYRGIEEAAARKNWRKALFLVNRICGICGITHTMNMCLGVEELNSIEVPERAKFLRTILVESNRIQSHLLTLGLMAHSMGFETLFQWCWKEREIILDFLEKNTGNRIHYGMVVYGGVRKDIPNKALKEYLKDLKEVEEKAKEIQEIFKTDSTILSRSKDVGVLNKKQVKEFGSVGPVARASGLKVDVRKDKPYAAYGILDWNVITKKDGDVWARNLIRAREILESIEIIRKAVDQIPEGEVKSVKRVRKVKKGEVFAQNEAPRGQNTHFLISGGKGPKVLRVRVPTFANLYSLKKMMIGKKVADAPVLILSIDPCFGCTDRMTVVDKETGEERTVYFDKNLK